MTRDSGVNLSIYCVVSRVDWWVGTCIFWMDAGILISSFCIGFACPWTTVHFRDRGGITKNMQKKVKGTITIDIRYTTFCVSKYFFHGEVCSTWDVTWAKVHVLVSCHHSGHNINIRNSPHIPLKHPSSNYCTEKYKHIWQIDHLISFNLSRLLPHCSPLHFPSSKEFATLYDRSIYTLSFTLNAHFLKLTHNTQVTFSSYMSTDVETKQIKISRTHGLSFAFYMHAHTSTHNLAHIDLWSHQYQLCVVISWLYPAQHIYCMLNRGTIIN